jgi:hypothetical protein
VLISGGTMPSLDLFVRDILSILSFPFFQRDDCFFQTYFQSDVTLVKSWYVPGTHYSRTCEDWIKLQDKNAKGSVIRHFGNYMRTPDLCIFCFAVGLKVLKDDALKHGRDVVEATKTFNRFRVFYMACSELFNYRGGQE